MKRKRKREMKREMKRKMKKSIMPGGETIARGHESLLTHSGSKPCFFRDTGPWCCRDRDGGIRVHAAAVMGIKSPLLP